MIITATAATINTTFVTNNIAFVIRSNIALPLHRHKLPATIAEQYFNLLASFNYSHP